MIRSDSDLTSASPRSTTTHTYRLVLAGVDVDVEREREDGEGGEEDEGVHEDGLAVGVEAAEVDVAVRARELAEQARRQQHEEHHAHHHGAPVRHAELIADQIRSREQSSRGRGEGGGLGEECAWFIDAQGERRREKVTCGKEGRKEGRSRVRQPSSGTRCLGPTAHRPPTDAMGSVICRRIRSRSQLAPGSGRTGPTSQRKRNEPTVAGGSGGHANGATCVRLERCATSAVLEGASQSISF